MENYRVKISAKNMQLKFHGCDVDYIRDVCKGKCCESSSSPQGTLITVHPSERDKIEALGAVVKEGILQTPNKKCPFKNGNSNLCELHNTDSKPFGCIASPFTLNEKGTLIVRNRYKLLKCYKDGQKPAYQAFSASLDLIFGKATSKVIQNHFKKNGPDLHIDMPARSFHILKSNDQIKKTAKTLEKEAKPTVTKPDAVTKERPAEIPMIVRCSHTKLVRLDRLVPHPRNPNQHPPEQITMLAQIMAFQGVRYPIKISNRSGFMTGGHGRMMAARLNGWKEFPCDFQDYDNEAMEYADLVADNKIQELAEMNMQMVYEDAAALRGQFPDFDFATFFGTPDFAFNEDGTPGGMGEGSTTPVKMTDQFLVPPFSVFDTKQGYWQERKRQWLSLGIQSEIGRGEECGALGTRMGDAKNIQERER